MLFCFRVYFFPLKFRTFMGIHELSIVGTLKCVCMQSPCQSLATCKLLVSLGSGSAQIISPYKLIVLNLCTNHSQLMYCINPLYTVQPFIPKGFPSLACNCLSLVISLYLIEAYIVSYLSLSCRDNCLSLVISLYLNHR